jgi:AraC-like DNA-binding protein
MLSIACLVATPASAHDVDIRIRGRAELRLFDDRAALAAHVRRATVAAVVIDLRDAAGRPTTGTVRALRTIAPRLPLFARCRLEETDCRALLDFARAGGTDIVVHGSGYGALLAVLGPRSAADGTATVVTRLVAAGLPPDLGPIIDQMLAHVTDRDAFGRAARAVGMEPRALRRRLARAGLPGARALQCWCRLLVAAHHLQRDDASIEHVAHAAGFSSGNALRNALHRIAATRPSSLRTAAGFDAFFDRALASVLPLAVGAKRAVAERGRWPYGHGVRRGRLTKRARRVAHTRFDR